MDKIEKLTKDLKCEDADVKWSAVETLGEIARLFVVSALVKALDDEGTNKRWDAATALSELGDPSAIPALVKALGDEDYRVRWNAAWALGEIGDPSAVHPLVEVLDDENDDVRRNAATALGKIGDPSAINPLVKALGDADDEFGWDARKALEKIGIPAIPALVKALVRAAEDEDRNVKSAAAVALENIGKPAVPALVKALENEGDGRGRIASCLAKIGDASAVPALQKALDDENTGGRMWITYILREIKDVSAAHVLVKALEDEEEPVQSSAATSLVEIGTPAVPALVAAYSGSLSVRKKVVETLGLIGHTSAIPLLLRAFGDRSETIQSTASKYFYEIIRKPSHFGDDLKELETFEKNLKESFDFLQRKCRDKDRSIKLKMVLSVIIRKVSEKKNQLSPKRGMILDDKPKPPKKGRMYRALRKRTI